MRPRQRCLPQQDSHLHSLRVRMAGCVACQSLPWPLLPCVHVPCQLVQACRVQRACCRAQHPQGEAPRKIPGKQLCCLMSCSLQEQHERRLWARLHLQEAGRCRGVAGIQQCPEVLLQQCLVQGMI